MKDISAYAPRKMPALRSEIEKISSHHAKSCAAALSAIFRRRNAAVISTFHEHARCYSREVLVADELELLDIIEAT